MIQYTIQPGDTLYAISRMYNVPIEAIFAVNPNLSPTNLIIGQSILIPIHHQDATGTHHHVHYHVHQHTHPSQQQMQGMSMMPSTGGMPGMPGAGGFSSLQPPHSVSPDYTGMRDMSSSE